MKLNDTPSLWLVWVAPKSKSTRCLTRCQECSGPSMPGDCWASQGGAIKPAAPHYSPCAFGVWAFLWSLGRLPPFAMHGFGMKCPPDIPFIKSTCCTGSSSPCFTRPPRLQHGYFPSYLTHPNGRILLLARMLELLVHLTQRRCLGGNASPN